MLAHHGISGLMLTSQHSTQRPRCPAQMRMPAPSPPAMCSMFPVTSSELLKGPCVLLAALGACAVGMCLALLVCSQAEPYSQPPGTACNPRHWGAPCRGEQAHRIAWSQRLRSFPAGNVTIQPDAPTLPAGSRDWGHVQADHTSCLGRMLLALCRADQGGELTMP